MLEQIIKREAFRIGFTHAGICSVDPEERVPFLPEWLDRNYHGEMKWMENPKREIPATVLAGLRTMIVVGLNYHVPGGEEIRQEGMISKYAWSADYHRILRPMLEELAGFVRNAGAGQVKAYVDTGPIVEKYWAQKAGVGWIGKHTNVISQSGSSWLFLGELLTDLKLQPDPPASDRCGTCSRCMEVCPTGAIVAPYVLDARLCISYLTIELRDSIPRELRPAIGNRIFGCDDCQDVCPWNTYAFAGDPRFTPRSDLTAMALKEYLQLSADAFRQKFAGSNVLRAKYRGFIRNCLVAAGNSRKPELREYILPHLASADEMIREHAVWALAQFDDFESRQHLENRRQVESSPTVLKELNHWLNS
jgi:epoxyqueuosine reductase